MKNLTTKRRFGVVSLLATALLMFVAGLFASAPAQAASGNPPSSEVVIKPNSAGAEGSILLHNTFPDQSVLFVVTSSTKGVRNVTVPPATTDQVDFASDWGVITVKYRDPADMEFYPLKGYTVPTVTPTPTQAASINVDPVKGIATITLTGNGSYHVIVYGDLTRPADVVTSGSATIQVGPFTVLTPVKVTVYGDGSGSGQTLADAVVAPPAPVLEDNTTSKTVSFCARTNPRAEAYVRTTLTVAEFLTGDHAADIVPPFDYIKQGVPGSYPGNLWGTAGQAVFNNNCTVIPKPSPTPSETDTPTPKPTPTATETTTATPKPTPTPTKTETATASPTTSSPAPVGNTPPATHQPAKSTEASSPTASRYPAARVDTAAGGEEGVPASAAPLLYSASALVVLIAGLVYGEGRRRH